MIVRITKNPYSTIIMASNTDHLSDCKYVFSHQSIANRLNNLPEIKASKRFDQKMAAAFAMELEEETRQRNRSWLKKHPQISLPDVSTDLIKNLF